MAMMHKNSHHLVGYWSRLRNGRDVPDQADIDPGEIRKLLPYTFILDCETPVRPVYRLAGTALCERFGFELKGTGFLGHWEPASRFALAPVLQQSIKARQPVCLSSIAATSENGMVELETILAPINSEGTEPRRFFGSVQLLSDPAPLLGGAITFERLIASRFIEEGRSLSDCDETFPRSLTHSVNMKAHPRVLYLRLVVNQDHSQRSAVNTCFTG